MSMTTQATIELKVDPYRLGAPETGITVRCIGEAGVFTNHDISHLNAPSLLAWLRSRGGCNPWAENTIGLLLHYEEPIAPDAEAPPRIPSDLE